MSKRLGLGKIRTQSTSSDGVVSTTVVSGPITKGQALIRARGILGPTASVQRDDEYGFFISVGIVPINSVNAQIVAEAHNWETALLQASDSQQARDWSDREIEIGNEIEQAKENLKVKAKAVGEHNFKSFMRGLVEKFEKRGAEKAKERENYQLWKEGRDESLELAKDRTKLLAAMAPVERLAFVEEEKQVAKVMRKLAYDRVTTGG